MSDNTATGPRELETPAAVLWDMDGTLVDTEPYWIAAERAIVEEAGGTWPDELAVQLVGQPLLVSATDIIANSPVTMSPEGLVEELLTRVAAAVRERGVPWRPGARELLREARTASIPSALVTMSWMQLVEPIVEQLPEGTFSAVVTGENVEHGKPHPEPYLRAAEALGIAPETCVAIEDSPTGVTSAVRAGVPTVAVPHIVEIPELPGTVQVESLAGVTLTELARLRNAAARTILKERTGG